MTDPEGPGGCLTSARGPSARRFFGLLGLKNVLGTLLGRSSFLSLMHNSADVAGGSAGRAGTCGWFHSNNTRVIAPV